MYLARVKAGHDKDHLYLVLQEERGQVYLVNGTTKSTDHPKRKNKKHVQLIKKLPQEVTDSVDCSRLNENIIIAELIEAYEQYLRISRD